METKPLIFSLVGSTASGKTALALRLAEFFAGQNKQRQIHLLSADSRQVYSGLEILSAADIPKNWQKIQQPQRQDRSQLVALGSNADWAKCARQKQNLHQLGCRI